MVEKASIVPTSLDLSSNSGQGSSEFAMQILQEHLPGGAALAAFCREDESKHEFTEDLRGILEVIAQTGKYWHDWIMLKSLLSFRLKQVLTEYHESQMAGDIGARQNMRSGETYPELVRRLDQALDSFVEGPPFTLQRLCEILLKPQSIYPNMAKVSLALEKILLVTSTLPICLDPYPSLPLSDPCIHENVEVSQEQNSAGPEQNGSQNTNTIVDEEMLDASRDDDPKAETNEHYVEPEDMKEKSSEFSVDSEQTVALNPSVSKDLPNNGDMIVDN